MVEDFVKRLKDEETRESAFVEAVEQYSPLLYRHIRRLVLFHDDANDLLQDTFIKAWTNLEAFRGDSRFFTWLYRIAMNNCFTFLANEQKRESLLEKGDIAMEVLEADPYFDGGEIELKLQKALLSLPPKQRQVFQLRYYEEMKYEEMSELLGTSVGALKASYHIAVEKIQASFLSED